MSLNLFRENLDKQREGSPCHVNQMTFYVKRIGTNESQKELEDIREKLYGLFPKKGEVNENLILAYWLGGSGVTDWESVSDDESDEEIPFSRKEAMAIFLNERYFLSLNQILVAHAWNFENYLSDESEGDIKKIKKH